MQEFAWLLPAGALLDVSGLSIAAGDPCLTVSRPQLLKVLTMPGATAPTGTPLALLSCFADAGFEVDLQVASHAAKPLLDSVRCDVLST